MNEFFGEIYELSESSKGFTDLPIALFSLLFAIFLIKKKNGWSTMFFILSGAAFLGAAVHIIIFPKTVKNCIWTVLYAFLYETIRRFSNLFVSYIKGVAQKENRLSLVFGIIFYALSVLFMWIIGKYDMYALILFSSICLIKIAICFIKSKRLPKPAILLIVLLLPPVILQATENAIPFAVVYEHIFILAGLFTAYKIACDKS